jgi:hypothetical protein
MSWKPEVFAEGEWCGNGLRFATFDEADLWARNLLFRWFVPTDSRAVESNDPVNYKMVDFVTGEIEAV